MPPAGSTALDTVDIDLAGQRVLDAGISHEVVYVIHDLAAHAAAIFQALRPGAAYYPVLRA